MTERRIITPEEDASYQRMIKLEMERQDSFQSECQAAFNARDKSKHKNHLFLNELELNQLNRLPKGDTTTSVRVRCYRCDDNFDIHKDWEYCPKCGTRFDEMIRLHSKMI